MATNTATEKPLTLREIILYNLAGFTFNVYDTILYAWVPYFYSPPPQSGRTGYIPLAALGIVLAGGRILDAVNDPLVGYWSDHTKSRWGRRKPFIFVASPILLLAFVFIWVPPVPAESLVNIVFLASVLFVYYWAYTGMLIPWFAVLPEMSPRNEDRIKVASIGVAIGVMGALLGGGLSGPIFSSRGPFMMGLLLGIPAFVLGEFTLFGIHERHQGAADDQWPGFFRVMKEVFTDRQFLSFAGMIMLVQLTYQLMLMNVPYFTTLILRRPESEASLLMAEVIILMAASAPLWYALLKRFPKRSLFRVIIALMATGFVLSYFIGMTDIIPPMAQAMIIFPVAAIPIGGMFTATLGVIADLTDYDELKSGRRREAVHYGVYGIVRKTGWALCALILSGVFSTFGYSVENPQGVRVIWLVCALSCAAGLAAFIPYRIGDSKEETRRIMGL
ncbi:MAG: MFS transporter [Spirochaetes bacterium]|nr:MFS transporter [Spirochaetota bacterium]